MAADVSSADEGAFHALWRSFAMIIVSEIGDKTFLIAAILAMRHPRLVVFAGAFGSLVVMSILSAELGHILPTLIPRKWTQTCAAVLFLVFGVKMLQEAREMKGGNEKIQEEMKEAEEDIEGDAAAHDGLDLPTDAIPLEAVEAGHGAGHARRRSNGGRPASPRSATQTMKSYAEAARNFFSYLLGPVFVQSFVLTFLGEWGDRSQISTIALAAADVSPYLSPASCYSRLCLTSGLRARVSEPVCRCARYDCRPLVLYSACRHGRSVCIHQNIRETWCVRVLRMYVCYNGYLVLTLA